MKKLLGLVVGALLAIGVSYSGAHAATLTMTSGDPSDSTLTAGLHIGDIHFFPPSISSKHFDDTVTLVLSSNTGLADLSTATLASFGIGNLTYALYNSSNVAVAFTGLVALGTTYFLHITGDTPFGGYLSTITATAVTPIPGALLLFVTALGGLGFAGWRRRKLAA